MDDVADLTRIDALISWLQEQEAHMLEKTLKLSKDPEAASRREACKITADTLTWVLDEAYKIRSGEVPPPPPPTNISWLERIKGLLAA